MSSTTPPPKQLDLQEFDNGIKQLYIEVSSAQLGGKVLSCSDDFFAAKENLIKPGPSVSMKGQFGPNGALYDGWESRRHNPKHDWVIIRLAPAHSHIHYVDIDTSHFSGNEAPASSVHALTLSDEELAKPADKLKLSKSNPRWEEILPVVGLGPNSRHVFEVGDKGRNGKWGALMVGMIPDGGMARFRAYGTVPTPQLYNTPPSLTTPPVDLISALQGGRIVAVSDANFSPPGNLLLPGRGVDMSDGWETRRSQVGRGKYAAGQPLAGKERMEWVIVRFGAGGRGVVRYVEIDTAFHPGNYPVAGKVEATFSEDDLPSDDAKWTTIVEKKPLGPHRQHWLDIERNVPVDEVFTHVRYSVFPDGGTKRLRIYGYPMSTHSERHVHAQTLTIPALPLTPEAFKPFGQVIQAHSPAFGAPKGVAVTTANQGTAAKFHRLSNVVETYPEGMLKRGGLHVSVIRAYKPQHETREGVTIDISVLERHAHTSQAFIPMGKGDRVNASGGAYVCLGALNGPDDKPDLSTLRAFLATSSQGVSYDQGIWHHSMKTVDGPLDYLVVEAQIGEKGNILDCENWRPGHTFAKVVVPPYTDKKESVSPYTSPVPTAKSSQAQPPHTHEEHHSVLENLVETITHPIDHLTHPLHPNLVPVHPTPITPEAFAPFGHVIKALPEVHTRPASIEVSSNPAGGVEKYSRQAYLMNYFPADSGAKTAIGVFRSTPKVGLERGKVFDIRLMERHPFSSQVFAPMGKGVWAGKGEDALPPGGTFLVIVAKDGHDGKPDPASLKAFMMSSDQALCYAPGVWHHPVLILDATLDLAYVETGIADGFGEPDARDCELLEWQGKEVFGRVVVPEVDSAL